MRQSKDQQIKDVVVGVALGVLAQGVQSVAGAKMTLELAFNRAGRSWPQAAQFPSIGGYDPGNLFWIGMGKSEGRRVTCAYWTEDQWASPRIRDEGWTVADALDHHASVQVQADDWIEPGRLFVECFKESEVRRG